MAGAKLTGNGGPNGRSDHNSTINKGGVAPQSHFMFTFSAPTGQSALFNRKTNFIDKAFKKEKDKIVTWNQEGFTNLAFRCERVSLPGRIIISSPYKEGNIGLVREYPTL